MSNILKKTQNLIDLYLYCKGQSEVPLEYNRWSFISYLAACLEDRVWYEKHMGSKLTPHLYVFLIGPSALGKGTAIRGVQKLATQTNIPFQDYIFSGSITYKAILDKLGKGQKDEETDDYYPPHGKLWLIMEELADDVGQGTLASAFIKKMTKLYTGDADSCEGDSTRKHGEVKVRNACVNWLAGSVKQWLLEVMTEQAIYSGPASRIVFVFYNSLQDIRCYRPIYPPDTKIVAEYIKARLQSLPHLSGKFSMTERAVRLERVWYEYRIRPKEEALWPSWKRAQDLVLKLGMIYSIAEGNDLVIREGHIQKGICLAERSLESMQYIIEVARGNPEIEKIDKVETVMRQRGCIERTPLSRIMYKKGMNAQRLNEALRDLEVRGLVRSMFDPKRKVISYQWLEED